MLLRQDVATSGAAYIEGQDISERGASSLFTNLGFCPQQNALFDRLTGREMLMFFSGVRGVGSYSERALYVDRWLELADLTEYADRRCGTYSGGNK
jgi:ATP-binding cassette subfamily A (ABC1) protein 3